MTSEFLVFTGPVVTIAAAMLVVALFLVLFRLVRGPTLADRVVALDLVASVAVAAIVVHAIGSGQPAALDAGLVLALTAFLGTVAFARHIEGSPDRD